MMSRVSLIVVDNFFDDPDSVRDLALSVPYNFIADYPGMRTKGINEIQSLQLKEKFGKILNQTITRWDMFDGDSKKHMNTCFQLCLKDDTTWVHHDYTKWAAVAYLTPDADIDSGTGFFSHKETGICVWDKNNPKTDYNTTDDMYDIDKWQLIAEVKNVYNRMILYRADQYHRSMVPGFGNNYLTGRLTQVFFFDTDE
jgi:hypothetical protein